MIGPIRRMVDFVVREREEWRRTARVVRLGLRELVKSQIPRMAAALSYRTIFSLIPVLVVGAAVMGQFLSEEELTSQINRLTEYVGFDNIRLEEIEAADSGQAGGELIGTGAPRLDEWIAGLVERVTGLPFSQIGFIGLLVLVYGAIAMLVELERSLNQIYGVPNGRAWVKRVTTYWTTLTLGLVFLLATFSVGDRVGDLVASIGRGNDDTQGLIAGGIVDFAVSVIINAILLLFAYMTVPNAKVHFRPALVGAAIAGLGWEIGKKGFTAYVANAVDNLQQLYGVLALLPLFLFWVYITWIIVLFGLQVSYALQHFAVWSEEREKDDGGAVDPGVGMRFAVRLAEAFEAGNAMAIDALATEAGVPAAAAHKLANALVRAGVARQTDLDGGETGYALARPAASVAAVDVLDVLRRARAGGEQGGSQPLDRRCRAAMEGMTLADVAAESLPAQSMAGDALPAASPASPPASRPASSHTEPSAAARDSE